MGLFSKALLLPLAPVAGVLWAAERLEALAYVQMYDPARIRQELESLQAAYDAGQLDDAELAEAEDVLLRRLEEADGFAQ